MNIVVKILTIIYKERKYQQLKKENLRMMKSQ